MILISMSIGIIIIGHALVMARCQSRILDDVLNGSFVDGSDRCSACKGPRRYRY